MNEKKNTPRNEVPKTGHIYDSIEELDHPPPGWFRALFYVTIAFGLVYFFHYTFGEGTTLTEEYRRTKDAEEYMLYQRQASSGPTKTLSEDELVAFVKDSSKGNKGLLSFQTKCASCHGSKGEGGIGPNLTDAYWLHGGKMTEVLATINNGVPDKGMPPWGPLLPAEEIQALTVFIRTLAGTNPPGAKAPQGSVFKSEL
jgi:cytochrome c oxidase cbb3-type subunit 3